METTAAPRKAGRYTAANVTRRGWIVRWMLRLLSIVIVRFLTRLKVEGLENIPKTPCIYAANHSSIYDAVLYFAFLPYGTQYVGPGDFRLKYPNRIAAEWTDVILVDRGSRDTSSLRAMLDTLKSGGQLGLFPEGGTWEKGLYNVKDGAAYLSMAAEAPIVPIAISGAYDLWARIWTFQRPEVTMKVLPPMPVPEKTRGPARKQLMEDVSIDLMHRIYINLEPVELDRYKLYMRQDFTGLFKTPEGANAFGEEHNFGLVADVISKKNLFSTFHEHLHLPVRPFLRPDRPHSALAFKAATDSFYEALTEELDGYMDYRRGIKARKQILAELQELSAKLATLDPNQKLIFDISVKVVGDAPTIEPPDNLPDDVV